MRSFRYNKLLVPFGQRPSFSWSIFCTISLFALIKIFSSSSVETFDTLSSRQVPKIDTNSRKLKEQAALDYLDLKSISGEILKKDVKFCGKERENYVPCYNLSANLLAGFKDGEEFDRHCQVSKQNEEKCLVKPPKEYKIPLRWPAGKEAIWSGNVKITKDQFLSSGTMTKRMMLLEENQIAFQSEDGLIFDDVKGYSRKLAEMIGLGGDSEFFQAGVRIVLDIGCGFGHFGAHLLSLNLIVMCIAPYEANGSQVQLALERGLPAMIGNFISKQLPYSSLSYEMVHCAQCGITWDKKDGMMLFEIDRVLKPGGYFVLNSHASSASESSSGKNKKSISTPIQEIADRICWSLIAQQDETFIWKKTTDFNCYSSRNKDSVPTCKNQHDSVLYYRPLLPCIIGSMSDRWIPIQNKSSEMSSIELAIHGKYCIHADGYFEDLEIWRSALKNYWSLVTPLIFSDHPKRPGNEDPLPPFNMLRNVMDMNARFGNLNSAFLEQGKSVWVMNVVPTSSAPNTLPLILDRGFAGTMHNWCEPFPTYPRTYDMLHGNGLLSLISSERCSILDLFLEMDRILRPEGWIILRDKLGAIEMARAVAARIRWEARVIDLQNGNDQQLLVCQKQFEKK